jgi:transposase
MERDRRSLSPQEQATLRIRAIQAIQGGMRPKKAAETFRVSRQTILNWRQKFLQGGWDALSEDLRGRPKTGGVLKEWQAANICKVIQDRTPDQLRMPFILWTADAVRELIERKYSIRLSTRTIQRYLKTWGFTPQKPVRRAYEKDPEAVEKWLRTDYPRLVQRAKIEKSAIYWGDEMGLRSDHQAGRFYSPKGKTPVRDGTGKRFQANMVSIISNRGDLAFMVFLERFTTEVFIRFLGRVIRHVKRKVILIIDGHRVHKSKKLQNWLDQHPAQIEIVFLPAYSPELNPDEMLNQDVKANAVGKRKPRNRKELVDDMRSFLHRRQMMPQVVSRYFHEENVRYAAMG